MTLLSDIRSLPKGILLAVFSIAVYRFGWAAGDAYFSIYLHSIVPTYTMVGILTGGLTLISALLTIPVGVLCDHIRIPSIIRFGQLWYPLIGLGYLAAGITHSVPLLILAVVLHGFALPLVWTGAETYIRTNSTPLQAARAFGLFDSGKLLWMLGLLLTSMFIDDMQLYLIFVPLIIFSLLSGFISENLPSARKKISFTGAWRQIKLHHHYLKAVFKDIITFNEEMHVAMLLTFFARVITSLGALFIPLYALQENMPLSKIGILIVIMNIPALLSFVFAELADRWEKMLTIMLGLLVAALSSLGLWLWKGNTTILFICSFFLMIGAAIMIPAVYAIITNLSERRYDGLNTALQNIMQRIGTSIAAVFIGVVSDSFGIAANFLFLAAACAIFIMALALLRLRWRGINNRIEHSHRKALRAPYAL